MVQPFQVPPGTSLPPDASDSALWDLNDDDDWLAFMRARRAKREQQRAVLPPPAAMPPIDHTLRKQRIDLETSGRFELECEQKNAVDPDRLPALPAPWVLIQGYFDVDSDLSVSLRIIPARRLAYVRQKERSLSGCRRKRREMVDYEEALVRVLDAPRVLLKERYLLRDDAGRAWYVDHFRRDNVWIAETEFGPDPLAAAIPPEWTTGDLTHDERGYSAAHAQPVDPATVRNWIAYAMRHGNRDPYPSVEDGTFVWHDPSASRLDRAVSPADPIPLGSPVNIPDPHTAVDADGMPRDPTTVADYQHDMIVNPSSVGTPVAKADPLDAALLARPIKTIIRKRIERDEHGRIAGVIEEHVPVYDEADEDPRADAAEES